MKHVVRIASLLLGVIFLLSGCKIENIAYAATINGEQVPIAEYRYVFENNKSYIAQKISSDGIVDWETATYEGKSAKEAVHDEAMKQITQLYIGAQKAQEAGIVPDNESNQYVRQYREQIIQSAGNESQYEAYLKEIGTTDDAVKSIFEKNYLLSRLLEQYMQTNPDFQLTEEDYQTYFFDNYVKAKHILFRTVDDNRQPLDDTAVAEAEQKAKDTLEQLRGGADFDTLMNELSEDPGLATNPNGYIFGRDMMDPPFEEAAYALVPGEISDIVKGASGFHILKRMELTEADYEEFKTQQIQQNVTGADYLANEALSIQFEQSLEEAASTVTIERNESELNKIKF